MEKKAKSIVQKQWFWKMSNDGLSKTIVGALPCGIVWVDEPSPFVVYGVTNSCTHVKCRVFMVLSYYRCSYIKCNIVSLFTCTSLSFLVLNCDSCSFVKCGVVIMLTRRDIFSYIKCTVF